jgi:hypothetical protein
LLELTRSSNAAATTLYREVETQAFQTFDLLQTFKEEGAQKKQKKNLLIKDTELDGYWSQY